LDEKRKEEEFCEGCGTGQLRKMIDELVEKLVGNKVIEKPIVVVEEKGKGVLYRRLVNGKWGWYKSVEENMDIGKYEGEIENGVPNGQGTGTYNNGNKFVGEWKDGRKNGQGSWSYSNGDKYVGELKDGKRTGQGTFTWSDGGKYVGGNKDGEMDGQGTHTWSNGNKYVGKWKNGKQHGQGTFTQPDGGKYVGEYKDGKRWNGTEYDKGGIFSNGRIIGKWVNGKYR
jgi:hypothetical protein